VKKKCDNIFNRFDRIPACDRQTGRAVLSAALLVSWETATAFLSVCRPSVTAMMMMVMMMEIQRLTTDGRKLVGRVSAVVDAVAE